MKRSNYLQSRVCFKNTQSPTCTRPSHNSVLPSASYFQGSWIQRGWVLASSTVTLLSGSFAPLAVLSRRVPRSVAASGPAQ